jgi:serine/threonine-protein kinase
LSSIHFLLGKTLGKYQVSEHLGHGGMAEVYLGRQLNLERQVAIKVLHPFLADETGFVTRFQREARIVATMRHPNIVQVYDFDHNEEHDIYYMVMEYIQGPTLKARLEENNIDVEEAVFIAASIADALDYAHRREMVHRDIKPGNIMFTDEGQPVLADFGIARMLSLTGLTASGAMVGTPAYMAPEIGSGESGIAASDIYSLGVVLYEMATGRLPFEAEVPMGLVMKHINDPVPSPSQLNPDISSELEEAMLGALAKKPQDRFDNAGKMATALREAMGHPPGYTTPRPSKRKRANKLSPTRRTPPSHWLSGGSENLDVEEEPVPEAKSNTGRPFLLRALTFVVILLLAGVLGVGIWLASTQQLSRLGAVLPLLNRTTPTTPEPTRVIAEATTAPPTATAPPSATSTPTATPVPSTPTPTLDPAYDYDAEVVRVVLTPDEAEAYPETPLLAYITLRNEGNAPWPEGTRLAFIQGAQMGAPSSLGLESLPPGGDIQILLPLQAPAEPGAYTSSWEVQLPDGRAISRRIEISTEVSTEAPPPTATTELASPETTSTPVEPLAVSAPTLIQWEIDEQQDLWYGTLELGAEGGTGEYQFYQEAIREETALSGDIFEFSWRRCEDFPLQLIVVSGDEVERWQGTIAYPEPETCGP